MGSDRARGQGEPAADPWVAPADTWPQIGDIVAGHDGYRPDPVGDLAGSNFFMKADGEPLTLRFDTGHLAVEDASGTRKLAAQVFRVRRDIYFIDCDHNVSGVGSAMLFDRARGMALMIEILAPAPDVPAGLLERIETRGSQSAVNISYRLALASNAESKGFPRSTALIGQQFRYTYSESHIYDHFYLSDRYYSWFCRQGPDAGLGDFEECDYFEVADHLILVCWREKLLPCVGITLEDHRAMRSVGKIFGADSHSGKSANSAVGAFITKIADIG